jgi:S1-C subfamily serine protease
MHRISMRFIRVTGAALLAVGLGFLGSFLIALRRELADARGTIEVLQLRTDVQRDELARLRSHVIAVDQDITRVQTAEASSRAQLLREVDTRTEAGAVVIKNELTALEERLRALRAAAEEHGRLLAEVSAREDIDSRQHELMAPTVRVNAAHEVGSGSLLWTRLLAPGKARSYVLTAWHICAEDPPGAPVDVDVYEEGEPTRTDRGRIVVHDPTLDLALVEIDSARPHRFLANLPPRELVESLRVFTPIYAIGCPLGYPPLPSSGEVTCRDKLLDGLHYWMVNAPTIFGNSGGGIYTAEGHELIGVLSRISAYKNMIDVAVPHMGLVTPIHRVYDWLDSTEYAFVYRDRLAEQEIRADATTITRGGLPAAARDATTGPR